jgi:hypothetical protein
MSGDSPSSFIDAQVELEVKTPYGYLSAVERPLLIFYGVMSLVYVAFAIGWTIVSSLQWRDLLRIQFWVGVVIWVYSSLAQTTRTHSFLFLSNKASVVCFEDKRIPKERLKERRMWTRSSTFITSCRSVISVTKQ